MHWRGVLFCCPCHNQTWLQINISNLAKSVYLKNRCTQFCRLPILTRCTIKIVTPYQFLLIRRYATTLLRKKKINITSIRSNPSLSLFRISWSAPFCSRSPRRSSNSLTPGSLLFPRLYISQVLILSISSANFQWL